MSDTRLLTALALPLLVAGSVIWGASRDSFAESEVARLRAHFAQVEQEMLARDVSVLTPVQRSRRAELVDLLREYREEGRFPKNEHFPGQRIPYFRDAHGTLCAMAYLIASTGSVDLVDNVARTRNNAYLPELVDEPGLTEWLDEHGLTVAEAARIQPTYGFPDPDSQVSEGFAMASVGLAVANGAAIMLNLQGGSRGALTGRGLFGILAGTADIALGLTKKDGTGTALTLGVTDMLVGGISVALGVTSLVRAQSREKRSSENARLELRPIRREVDGRSAIGLAARLSF
jgi:hypothetical protein